MKSILVYIFLFATTYQLMSQDKAKLIYIGDPMCSWCYGFTNELSKSIEELENKVEFEIIMGGLRPYNTEKMTELKSFLTHHWEEVHNRSGQEFSYEILDRADIAYDTEPPSRAVVVMKQLQPDKAMSFFKRLQVAFYKENKNMNSLSSYIPLLEDFGVDEEAFKLHFESDYVKQQTKEEFMLAGQMGVRGFPTLLLKKGEDLYEVCNGYTESKNIINRVNKIMAN